MSKKISTNLKIKFAVVWLSLLLILVIATAVRVISTSQSPPSLGEVLSQEHAQNEKRPFDFSMIIASVVGFSLAAMSLAKGYEIVSRRKSADDICLPKEDFSQLDRKLGEKSQEVEKLSHANEDLLAQNGELDTRSKIATCEIEELKRIELMLRKSNISLGKDCERLKAENEELMLQANSIKIKATAPKRVAKTKVKILKKKATRPKASRKRRGRK
jgi:hypothetical protein